MSKINPQEALETLEYFVLSIYASEREIEDSIYIANSFLNNIYFILTQIFPLIELASAVLKPYLWWYIYFEAIM